MGFMGWIAIAMGSASLWIAAKHNIGWLIGALATFVWYLYAVPIHAYPVMVSATIYGIIDVRNLMVGYANNKRQRNGETGIIRAG